MDHFERLKAENTSIQSHATSNGAEKFFVCEVARFLSIAGTIKESNLDYANQIDARIFTHILTRSILENYFWLLYIFDEPSMITFKYGELVDDFKIQYLKLYNEVGLPHKSAIENPDSAWAGLKKAKDLKSMLDSLRNDYGDRLGFLYFVYRIASFDTHGKSMKPLFDESFGKNCHFPYLELDKVFDYVANAYCVIWQSLNSTD